MNNNVHVLDFNNFNDFISNNGNVLVKVYADWCGHCKNLKPAYQDAATELKGIAVLAEIDGYNEQNSNFLLQYKIQGFPTLLWFKNGNYSEYDGTREKDAIVNWVNSRVKTMSGGNRSRKNRTRRNKSRTNKSKNNKSRTNKSRTNNTGGKSKSRSKSNK